MTKHRCRDKESSAGSHRERIVQCSEGLGVKVACSPSPRQSAICTAAGMNPSDVQSESEPRYFDPEEADMSEQEFAASLEASPGKPQFEIDEAEPECQLG